MGDFKADDAEEDQKERNQSDDVIGVSKKQHAADDSSCGADPCPDSVGCADGDKLHRLGDGEEAKYDENDGDDTGNESSESLAKL